MQSVYDTRRTNLRALAQQWGGVWDDPLADIRRRLSWTLATAIVALLAAGIEIALHVA